MENISFIFTCIYSSNMFLGFSIKNNILFLLCLNSHRSNSLQNYTSLPFWVCNSGNDLNIMKMLLNALLSNNIIYLTLITNMQHSHSSSQRTLNAWYKGERALSMPFLLLYVKPKPRKNDTLWHVHCLFKQNLWHYTYALGAKALRGYKLRSGFILQLYW